MSNVKTHCENDGILMNFDECVGELMLEFLCLNDLTEKLPRSDCGR